MPPEQSEFADVPVTISGTLTTRELLKFQYFTSYRSRWMAVFVGAVTLFILGSLVFTIVSAMVYNVAEIAVKVALRLGFLLIAWFGLLSAAPYLCTRQMLKTQASLRGPVHYVFSDREISHRSEHGQGNFSWSVLWKVYETKSLFCLYLSSAMAVIVPKRFFESPEQQERWRRLVERRIHPKRIIRSNIIGKLI
jgi:hypothetical protein